MPVELDADLETVAEESPLVNAVTNDVTVNDVAQTILHWGGLPVMSDDVREVGEMVAASQACLLNMGTVSEAGEETMVTAGRAASEHGAALVVDPVGAGATPTRSRVAERLTTELAVDVIKGNRGEIAALAGEHSDVRGVESIGEHADIAETAMACARQTDAVVVASGKTDVVATEEAAFEVDVGHSLMGEVVGTGCLLGGTLAAFCGAVDDPLSAALAGTVAFGLAGEAAAAGEYGDYAGPASYEIAFFDAVAGLDPTSLSNATDRIARVPTAQAQYE